MAAGPVSAAPVLNPGKTVSKGEISFTSELEEILKRITEIKNIAGNLKYFVKYYFSTLKTDYIMNYPFTQAAVVTIHLLKVNILII